MFNLLTILLLTSAELILTISRLGLSSAGIKIVELVGSLILSLVDPLTKRILLRATSSTSGKFRDNVSHEPPYGSCYYLRD